MDCFRPLRRHRDPVSGLIHLPLYSLPCLKNLGGQTRLWTRHKAHLGRLAFLEWGQRHLDSPLAVLLLGPIAERRGRNAVLDANLAQADVGNAVVLGELNNGPGPDKRIQFFSGHLGVFSLGVAHTRLGPLAPNQLRKGGHAEVQSDLFRKRPGGAGKPLIRRPKTSDRKHNKNIF